MVKDGGVSGNPTVNWRETNSREGIQNPRIQEQEFQPQSRFWLKEDCAGGLLHHFVYPRIFCQRANCFFTCFGPGIPVPVRFESARWRSKTCTQSGPNFSCTVFTSSYGSALSLTPS